jgi:hypothetical protein
MWEYKKACFFFFKEYFEKKFCKAKAVTLLYEDCKTGIKQKNYKGIMGGKSCWGILRK